jgi:sialate O-acetylesterase
MLTPLARHLAVSLLAFVFTAAFVQPVTGAAATHPHPEGDDVDLWVAAGQSNMQGVALLPPATTPNPLVRVFDLTGQWVEATPPTHRVYAASAPVFKRLIFKMNPSLTEAQWAKLQEDDRAGRGGGLGPDLGFADLLARATGRRIGLIPCALGGTNLTQWSPSLRDQGTESLYGNMLHRIQQVGGRIKGVIWYQGEGQSGSRESADRFTADFLNLIDSLRRDTGIPDLPFIYVQIGRFANEDRSTDPFWQMIQEHQRNAAALRPNLWVVPSVDLALDDLIHIGTEGQQRLGRRLAETALTHVYGKAGYATPINYVSHEIRPSTQALHHCLRVRFSGVTGRLQSAGRPAGFELIPEDPKKQGPMVYKVEFDPADPASVLVWYSREIKAPVKLVYGLGMDRYTNITDGRDMAIPAFGPVIVTPQP